jgi:hypothetical protein
MSTPRRILWNRRIKRIARKKIMKNNEKRKSRSRLFNVSITTRKKL